MKKSSVTAKDINEQLYDAARDGDLSLAKKAVEKGADVNCHDASTGLTPLHIAALNNRVDMVDFLLGNGAQPNVRCVPRSKQQLNLGNTPLMYASHGQIIHLLLRGGADINAQNESGCTALHMSAMTEDWNSVLYLLQNGADRTIISEEGITAFEVVRRLSDNRLFDAWVAYEASEIAQSSMNESMDGLKAIP